MSLQIDFWQLAGLLVSLLLGFAGLALAAGRTLLAQVSRQLDIRFAAIEAGVGDVQRLEREFLRWQAILPLDYVRREDYVRGQTVIEAKLDAINTQITALLREGVINDRPAR